MNINQKIARASLILILTTVAGFVLSVGKEMIVASVFGVSRQIDAFYAALTLPNMISTLVLSTFGSIFLPVFIRYKLRNEKESTALVSETLSHSLAVLFVLLLAVFAFSGLAIRHLFHGLPPETAALAVPLMQTLGFLAVLTGPIAILSVVLNAYDNFFLPGLLPIPVALATIVFVVFLKPMGIYALAYGLLAGYALHTAILYFGIRKTGIRLQLKPRLSASPAVKEMLSLAPLFLLAITAIQMNTVIARILASYLAAGSIAALAYADKLIQFPLMAFSVPLGTALFPYISTHVSERKFDELSEPLTRSITLSAYVLLPATALMVILAKPLVQILLQRGAFTAEAASLTSSILVCYSFQLLFYTVIMLASKVFLAIQDMTTYLKINAAGFILNVLLSLVLMRVVTPPAAGIALATSLVLAVNAALFVFALHTKAVRLSWGYLLRETAKIAGATVVMIAAAWPALVYSSRFFSDTNMIGLAGRIAASSASGMAAYLAASYLFRINDSSRAFAFVREKLRFGAAASQGN